MSSPVPRRISLLCLFLSIALSAAIPRLAGAVEPVPGTTVVVPDPGNGSSPAIDLPGTDLPSGPSDGNDEGYPTDIDQITQWLRNVFGLDWPLLH